MIITVIIATVSAAVAGAAGFLIGRRTHPMDDYEIVPEDEQQHDEGCPTCKEIYAVMEEVAEHGPQSDDPEVNRARLRERLRSDPRWPEFADCIANMIHFPIEPGDAQVWRDLFGNPAN